MEKSIVIALGLTAVLVWGTVGYGVARAQSGTTRGALGWHRVWAQPGGAHRLGRLCEGRTGEGIDRIDRLATSFLRLDPGQAEAWKTLVRTLRDGAATIEEACAELRSAEIRTVPAAMGQVERGLEIALTVVREVRPAAVAFYATLSAEQQRTLDDLIGRHHRH
jgi:hypothetical protein